MDGEQHEVKTQLEHVLERPDSYIGSTETEEAHQYVLSRAPPAAVPGSKRKRELERVAWETLRVNPALMSIIQEILVNAMDRPYRDPNVRSISISWDAETREIVVRNDGDGIPVREVERTVHGKVQKIWIPVMVFYLFLSGSNFDDGEGPRFTGGRNGIGGKGCNAWSTKFVVDTGDPREGKRLTVEFKDNMRVCGKPKIRKYSNKGGFTEIRFVPDFARLGASFDGHLEKLLRTRAVEVAACVPKRVSVKCQGEKVDVRSFRDFAQAFAEAGLDGDFRVPHSAVDAEAGSAAHKALEAAGSCAVLEVCAMPKPEAAGAVRAVGFVNGIRCPRGKHVDYVLQQLATACVEYVRKAYRRADLSIRPATVKGMLFVLVKCMVDSPTFTSQCKTELATPVRKFGFSWVPPDAMVRALMTSGGLAQRIYERATRREQKTLAADAGVSTRSRHVHVEKYDPAGRAHIPGSDCWLILTEGDSAKATAVAGLSVVGRARYGVFPLRGKPANVRDMQPHEVLNNKELMNVFKIVGVVPGRVYTSKRELRYAKILVMTDQDLDGDHIKALVLNAVHKVAPSVLKLDPDFVVQFATPLVRAVPKAKGAASNAVSFYTQGEFSEWLERLRASGGNVGAWRVKYYKGLGTSTAAEAREYFRNLKEHLMSLTWTGEKSDAALHDMFAKSRSNRRKQMLLEEYDPASTVDFSRNSVSYEEFVLRGLLHYSWASIVRSIPRVSDGWKPSQRKAFFGIGRCSRGEKRVSQAAADAASKTAYHHGETSMQNTMVCLAQNHVGANNVNVLMPIGQFGSRLNKPEVHAQPRYIFTDHDPTAATIFPKEDEPVLAYAEEDGETVEPEEYRPVLCMLAVNGCCGIGTGWSSFIPAHNWRDVVAYHRAYLDDASDPDPATRTRVASLPPLTPWYHGFTGAIHVSRAGGKTAMITTGKCDVDIGRATVHITELPVGVWTDVFLASVAKHVAPGAVAEPHPGLASPDPEVALRAAKGCAFVRRVENNSTEASVDVTLHCHAPLLSAMGDTVHAVLGMTRKESMNNMHAIDRHSKIRRYSRIEEILEKHSQLRMETYVARKAHLVKELAERRDELCARERFVRAVISGELRILGVPSADVEAGIEALGLPRIGGDYEYLRSIKVHMFEAENADDLHKRALGAEATLKATEAKTPSDMWRADLDRATKALEDHERRKMSALAEAVDDHQNGAVAEKAAAKPTARVTKRRKIAPKSKKAKQGTLAALFKPKP